MFSHLKNIVILILLQAALDVLYVHLYPTVNPVRATLIGATALVVLMLPPLRWFVSHRLFGALSIYSSALFGALLVQAGILISKSPLSAGLHVAILIATYGVLMLGWRVFRGKQA